MFWLESGPLSATTTNIIYLCRPLVKWIKIIAGQCSWRQCRRSSLNGLHADQLKRLAREPSKHTYTLLLVPRISTLVSRILEEEGVLGDITISSYNLQFIPVAEDIVSLENESAFKELYTVRIPHGPWRLYPLIHKAHRMATRQSSTTPCRRS